MLAFGNGSRTLPWTLFDSEPMPVESPEFWFLMYCCVKWKGAPDCPAAPVRLPVCWAVARVLVVVP